MSLTAPARPEAPMPILRYFDVVVLLVAAPVMLLIGVPALGYGVGAGAWIAMRAVGVGLERATGASAPASREIGLRLGYMLGRLFVLALAVIIARSQGDKNDGLTALAVIVFAFTVQLAVSFTDRSRTR